MKKKSLKSDLFSKQLNILRLNSFSKTISHTYALLKKQFNTYQIPTCSIFMPTSSFTYQILCCIIFLNLKYFLFLLLKVTKSQRAFSILSQIKKINKVTGNQFSFFLQKTIKMSNSNIVHSYEDMAILKIPLTNVSIFLRCKKNVNWQIGKGKKMAICVNSIIYMHPSNCHIYYSLFSWEIFFNFYFQFLN